MTIHIFYPQALNLQYFFYAPNFEKVGGHIGFGLSVCTYVCMYVCMYVCIHVQDIVLKLHVWIPHGKIADAYLAHLSQRLIGELIGYSWSGVRPSASVVRRPSVVNNFKRLLLQNRLPDQCQILCGASLGRGNESLFAASGSHDQDGRHAHIW